jgi:ligand-binding SRPBCC domain-containing protein
VIRRLQREQFVPGEPAAIWDFFASPANLAKITPSQLRFEIVGPPPAAMHAGQMIEYRIGLLPGITTGWLTEITHVQPGRYFVDEQRIGPYKLWHHEHHFTPTPDHRGVHMRDVVTYDVGWGPLGDVLHALWIGRQLDAIFDHRTKAVAQLFRP